MDDDSIEETSYDVIEELIQNYHSEGNLIRTAIIDSVKQALDLKDIGATRRTTSPRCRRIFGRYDDTVAISPRFCSRLKSRS